MKDLPESIPVTCYSKEEGGIMKRSQEIRQKSLLPLLQCLEKRGFRAGHITLLSAMCGLAFCPLLILDSPVWALGFLLLHVLLDGLDGPLARYLGQAGDRGSFTDTAADQLVVSATTITLICEGMASPAAAGWYLFLYTSVVVFAMVRNALSAPYSWLVRPRFVVYFWIAIEIFLWPGSLDFILWIAAGLLAIKAVTGFTAIRNKMA